MKFLITGGAGYIGSFMTKRLLDEKNEVIVLDSLERGSENKVDKRAIFEKGNLLDKDFLNKIFLNNKFDSIIHFAAFISMGESMFNPYLYFNNNFLGSLNLIETASRFGVKKIIFSSTAGVYGNPNIIPISEDHPKNPENPYGESKLMVEKILEWYRKIKGLNFVALRYFNACGASLDGLMGEEHKPESHIIPNVLRSIKNKNPFSLFGTDYKTLDGTCVRDYIHVLDLVEAHVLALKKLEKEKGGFIYNVGTGKGFSNKEIIEKVKKVTGINFEIKFENRRPGDTDSLIADVKKIKAELGFNPQYSDLDTIIKTAWKWHKR